MKIEVKDNQSADNTRQCEFPYGSEYSGFEESENNLKIFIKRKALENIDEYLSSDMNNELGGVLVGEVCINDGGKNFICIENLIIAKHTNSSLSRLTFTHETWSYINEILERHFPGKKILGWFHSHPGHTVFLSTFDVFIQENFFNMEYMVAYVFDPTIKERGFFFWKDGKIVKAKGFYIYNNNGEDDFKGLDDPEFHVTVNPEINEPDKKYRDENQVKKNIKTDRRNIIILALLLLTLLLLILTIYNLYDLKQKALLKDEYSKDLSELRDSNQKLNERLNSYIKDTEISNNSIKENKNNSKVDSGKALTKYTVKPGDTVDKISDEYYKNKSGVQLIIEKNNLKSKWDLKVGQVLELPLVNDQ